MCFDKPILNRSKTTTHIVCVEAACYNNVPNLSSNQPSNKPSDQPNNQPNNKQKNKPSIKPSQGGENKDQEKKHDIVQKNIYTDGSLKFTSSSHLIKNNEKMVLNKSLYTLKNFKFNQHLNKHSFIY